MDRVLVKWAKTWDLDFRLLNGGTNEVGLGNKCYLKSELTLTA